MRRSRPGSRALAVGLVLVLLALSACSSKDDDSTASGDTAGTSDSADEQSSPGDDSDTVEFTVQAPEEITSPPAEGNGTVFPQPAPPLPAGYTEEELFVGGTATSFEADDTPEDGMWTAAPADEADYRTRVIVRRPPAEDFSGTVVVEWFNVSAIEASPDWGYLSDEIAREGHAYIGVSAQSQGVEGGATVLDVSVDEETATEQDVDTDTSGLVNIDPDRYGTLTHPGDAYAYDIFSQVGRAASESPDELLGGLEPEQVIAVGESQSALFLTTLVDAVHPLDPTFDGFLIHSRGAAGTPLSGDLFTDIDVEDIETYFSQGQLIRTDVDVPVFMVETESDLLLLGFDNARQPDTDRIRTWEVAGTAHADAHAISSVLGSGRDASVGSLIGCTEPINTGPHHEVVQAALHHLVEWVAGGSAPPEAEPIELADGDETVIVRDEQGIALGGVRNPLTDVPIAATTGEPPGGGAIEDLVENPDDLCILFGTTSAFDQDTLVELYGSGDAYLDQFTASAEELVATGFLLQADADALVAEAEANTALFG